MGVSLLLTLVKAAAGFWTGSLALLGSALDSGLDLAASAVNALFLRHAAAPPDEHHPFGHGKAEGVASLVQSALISISGGALLVESIRRILSGTALAHTRQGIAVLAVSIPVALALGSYLRRVGRRRGSLALQADAVHYLSDVVSAGGSLLALLFVEFGAPARLDPIASLLISGYILHTAWRVARDAYDLLLDRALPDVEAVVADVVSKHTPPCAGFHALRARAAGSFRFVELRLNLDERLSFVDAHRVTEEVSTGIAARAGPGTEVIVHPDPVRVGSLSS